MTVTQSLFQRVGGEGGRMLCLVAIVLMPVVSCTSTGLVTVDYAKDYDFSAVRTFQYLDTTRTNASSPEIDSVIRESILQELTSDGLTEVSSESDLVATYHIVRDNRVGLETPEQSFGAYGGWGPGWARWGYEGPSKSWKRWRYDGPTLPTVREYGTVYPEGTLILDAFEPTTKRLLWRGTGKMPAGDDPIHQAEQTKQTIKTISNRWRRILAESSGVPTETSLNGEPSKELVRIE